MIRTTRAAEIFTALGHAPLPRDVRPHAFWVLCPVHDDHDPSCHVRSDGPRAGSWRCYSCGARGDTTDLVQIKLGLSFREARDWLGDALVDDKAWEPLPARVVVVYQTSLSNLRVPKGVNFSPLEEWPTPARRYLLEERKVPEWQAERWGIGYAARGRLSGRIVLMLRNAEQEPRNYMARSFCGHEERYLTPRGDEVPDYTALFGEENWKTSRALDRVYVTEGALNALAVERALSVNDYQCPTIAAVGGASELSTSHTAKLAMFREVVVLSDSDKAGDGLADKMRAALKRLFIARNGKLVRVRVRGGKDIDEMDKDELVRQIRDLEEPL